MQQEIAQPLSLPGLASRVNLSPSRFSHLFRQELGASPARYLRDLRLDSALMLLYDSTLSIKEVMAAVGFNDPSHFTRDFAKRHDVTPTEFRNRAHACDDPAAPGQPPLSSNIRQQTVNSANDPTPQTPRLPSIVERWRDERAKGA
jgi:AraC-like DNA-binding protein